jgi:hypothetical protein
MASAAHDLANYERDVTEHLLFGMARSRIFDDVSAGKPWNADLETGALEIGGQVYESQILGSFAPGPRTFLWAWANPGAEGWATSLQAVNEVREFGEKPGYAVFREPNVPETRVHPRELALMAAELAGGHPVYAADAGGPVVFLLVGTPVDPRTVSLAYLPGILVDFQSISRAEKASCVARFLERLGFTVERSKSLVSGKKGERTRIDVAIDEHGRIANVELTVGE